jgi:peptidoglycan/LPS O-acetylase OafA/YrhL
VILVHAQRCRGFPAWPWLHDLAAPGGFGVTIFFVISGFLITWLLLREEQRFGRFDLKLFYARRAARVAPPALFYVAVTAALRMAGRADSSPLELAACALFSRNLVAGSEATGHYWSLAIEEQFYLAWPCLLMVLGTQRRRFAATAALVVLAPVWRQANIRMFGAVSVNWLRADLRYDALLLGALLALARHEPATRGALDRASRVGSTGCTIIACALLGTLLAPLEHQPKIVVLLLPSLQIACVGALLQIVLSGRAVAATWLLECKLAVWIGKISYSLYLWQQPSFYWWQGGGAEGFTLGVMSAFGRGAAAFFLVERPFDRLRTRFQRR